VRLPPIVALAAVAAGASAFAACGGGSGSSGADGGCGPIRREALDPGFLVHVLGEAQASYQTDPPTSGPHQPSPPVEGVLAEPLSRPIQVGVLEAGDVLLQHRPDLPADQRRALEGLAGDGVVVAPNPDLDQAVVATAWLYKRTCDEVDLDALEDFAAQRQGKAPGVEEQ
jgi:hypothetical protein